MRRDSFFCSGWSTDYRSSHSLSSADFSLLSVRGCEQPLIWTHKRELRSVISQLDYYFFRFDPELFPFERFSRFFSSL